MAETDTPTDSTTTFLCKGNQEIITSDSVRGILLSGPQIADWLEISPATWRGWVAKGLAPKADSHYGNKRQPLWHLQTLGKYLRNAPGGRLGYPVE